MTLPKQRSRCRSNEEFEKGLDDYEKAHPDIDAVLWDTHQEPAEGLTWGPPKRSTKENVMGNILDDIKVIDRTDQADAERFRWMLAGNGYFMEENLLCGHDPVSTSEADDAVKMIDEQMKFHKDGNLDVVSDIKETGESIKRAIERHPHLATTNLDDTMRQMHEASVNGAVMDHGKSFPRPEEQISITKNMRTKSPAFDALASLIGNWSLASKILTAIETGVIPDIVTFNNFAAPYEYSLQVLDELMARMVLTKRAAKDAHAAWNPAEVVTQLKLEIETGKYRGAE